MLHLMQTLLTITLISVIVFFVSETVRNLEREEVKLLRDIRNTLHSILGLLKPVPFYARLTVMPKSIEVGQTATAALQVLDLHCHALSRHACQRVIRSRER